MKKLFFLIPALGLLLAGCSQVENKPVEKSNHEKEVDACLNQGGVPVRSIWDNRLKDCKFK